MRRETCQDQTDRIRYLESEVDDYRRREEQAREREDRARRERRREREAEIAQAARQADTWPEALRKNAALCRAEIEETQDGDDDMDFWSTSAAACNRALEIWRAIEQEKAAEIAAAEAALKELRDSVRLETARRLRLAEPLIKEFAQIAQAIEESTPEEFLNW